MHYERESAILCGDVAWVAGQTVRSTWSPVNPGPGRRLETLQGGRTNGTAIWQKEEPDPEGVQEAEKADARRAQAATYRIQVTGAAVSIRGGLPGAPLLC